MKIKIILSLLFLIIVVWSFVFVYENDSKFKVYYLDIGQGDSIFIETPEKFQVLIDGGPDNSVLSELSSIMPFYDREIDLLVLSHPQQDHLFGLIEVLKRYKVKNILFASVEYDSGFYDEFKRLVDEKNINKIEAKAGLKLDIGEIAFIDILYPFYDVSGSDSDNANDVSLAFIVNFLNKKFIFSGDAELKEELDLVNSNLDIKADVLKVGHHGSKTSTSELFLDKVNPEIAVISVGENNPYNHPSDIVMERLKDIKTFRTDIDGMVTISTDGLSLDYKTEL